MEKFTLRELKVMQVSVIEMFNKIKDVNPKDKRLEELEKINHKINLLNREQGLNEYVHLNWEG